MKVTAHVYYLGGTIAVAELTAEEGDVFVAECSVDGATVKVLPQSLRKVEDIRTVVLDFADDQTPQDRVDRTAHGIERFLQRLAEFSVDEVAGCDVEQLVERAELGERALRGLRLSVRERA